MPANENRADAHASMLTNRIVKNLRHRRKWARRVGTDAFRVYDHDIPEVPLVVDLYGEHVLVADGRRDDEREAAGSDDGGDDGPARPFSPLSDDDPWFCRVKDAVAASTAVPLANVHGRVRRPQRGAAQYARADGAADRLVVHEDGLRFLVDLDTYLDTGLFLDHRPLRARFGREAAGKTALNLFAYTGAFSVHAAARGARATTSVDLSQTYLNWFGDNLALNGIDGRRHERLRVDAFDALRDLAAARRLFDIVIVDPPTFSNSKRMIGTFDVQRDHAALIARVVDVLAPGGTIYFSTNRRKFSLDDGLSDALRVEDITDATVPEDFAQRRPHRAWRIVAPLALAARAL